MASLTDELVVVAQWRGTRLDVDDFPVLESIERKDGFRGRTVGEVRNGMAHTDFVVLKQDAMGFGTNGARTCKRHDVALGHDSPAHMRVEFAVIVNDGVKLFFVSGLKSGFILGKDAHEYALRRHHIIAPSGLHDENGVQEPLSSASLRSES